MTKTTTLSIATIMIAASFHLSASVAQVQDKVSPYTFGNILTSLVSLNNTRVTYDLPESIGGGEIRILPGGILLEKKGSLLLGPDGQQVLYVNGKTAFDSNDFTGNNASEYLKLSESSPLLSAAGLPSQWKYTYKTAEGEFEGILFRSGKWKEMIPGLFTTKQSQTYVSSTLTNADVRWPYRSCTDIVLVSSLYGARLALGKLEFLIIKQRIMCNFGEGSKVKVLESATPVRLINSDGSMEKVVQEGTFVNVGGTWKRQ